MTRPKRETQKRGGTRGSNRETGKPRTANRETRQLETGKLRHRDTGTGYLSSKGWETRRETGNWALGNRKSRELNQLGAPTLKCTVPAKQKARVPKPARAAMPTCWQKDKRTSSSAPAAQLTRLPHDKCAHSSAPTQHGSRTCQMISTRA